MNTHAVSPSETDLCSLVFRTPCRPLGPPVHGRHLHAAFLRWVAALDQPLAAELHAANRIRPFTVALLPTTGEGAEFALRCSLLDRRLIAIVQERLGASDGLRLRLNTEQYDFRLDPDDPWCAATSWRRLTTTSRPDKDIRLEFATPTCFSRTLPGERRRLAMFPQPELMWDSWVRKWLAFGPPVPGLITLAASAEHWVLVSAFRLETRTVDLGRFRQKGFLGWVDYELQPDTPPDVARNLGMLADFASFAGTGYKTAMGLGLTRHSISARKE